MFTCRKQVVSASLSVAQPFLLNLTLRALGSDKTLSARSNKAPMHSLALALPDAYYAFPARVIQSTLTFLDCASTSTVHNFSAAMAASPTDGQRNARQMAYFYGTVSFFCALVKAQTDLQHLYFGRRATQRAQSELMGSIYEKSLVRKDITGAIASDAKKRTKKGSKEEAKEADKPVESADVGKIVTLISTDSGQVAVVGTALSVSSWSRTLVPHHSIP